MVQWLRLHTPNAGGPGSIPGQGARSHLLQLRVHKPQLNIPLAETKEKDSDLNSWLYLSVQILNLKKKFLHAQGRKVLK